jgi:soluble lytic murein transglycosylase-like protein
MSGSPPIRVVTAALALAALVMTGPVRAGDSCPPGSMPGLQAAWGRLRQVTSPRPGEHAWSRRSPTSLAAAADAREIAAWDEFSRLAVAVLGLDSGTNDETVSAIASSMASASPVPVPCNAQARARDRVTWQLLVSGYSAAEVLDILAGRLSKHEIDTARRLLLAGFGATRASSYLEARAEARRTAMAEAAGRPVRPGAEHRGASDLVQLPPALSRALEHLAQSNGVDPRLVRAVVTAESAGDAAAVSPAGAIGLMQLMPATARMLGVNPRDPVDNLRGGTAYLAGLLRLYGDVESALIAYNAGPTHADRVRRGEAVLYGETRRYVDRVTSLLGRPTAGFSGASTSRQRRR